MTRSIDITKHSGTFPSTSANIDEQFTISRCSAIVASRKPCVDLGSTAVALNRGIWPPANHVLVPCVNLSSDLLE